MKLCPVNVANVTCTNWAYTRCDKPAEHCVTWHDDGYENRKTVWFCDAHAVQYRKEPEKVWW